MPSSEPQKRQPSVYLADLRSSDNRAAIRAGLEWVHFHRACKPSSRIFLKPNLTYPQYLPGVMTSIGTIEDTLAVLREYTDHLYIGDSDSGGYNRFAMDDVYARTGLVEIAERYGAKIVNLSREPQKAVRVEYGNRRRELFLPSLLLEKTDFLISMPVPKIHTNTIVSLSMKNLWGCIPRNTDRLLLHPYIGQVLAQLVGLIRANYVIMDGRYGLNRNGPMRGDPVAMDWVLVSDHLGAADATACGIMQVDWRKVPFYQYAARRGLLPPSGDIRFNRDPSEFRRVRFFLRRELLDYPGYIAFHHTWAAWLAYFSPCAALLHRLLYLFRNPFYDYSVVKPLSDRKP